MLWSACISVAAKENGGVFHILLYKKAILPSQNRVIYYFATIAKIQLETAVLLAYLAVSLRTEVQFCVRLKKSC
jgi:hypothetical protein